MSAIEMMDPKMDAGMMCNQIQRKVLNFEQAVGVSMLNNIKQDCQKDFYWVIAGCLTQISR